MRYLLGLALSIVVGVAVVVAGAGVAVAYDQYGNNWANNDPTGYCGDQSGGYVLALQQCERSYGSNGDSFDSYFGPHTYNGLVALQRYYGISADGCAGPQTWTNFYTAQMSRCSPGYVCNRPTQLIYLGHTIQYFDHYGTCTWASYTNNNPVAGPVRQFAYYAFSSGLGGELCYA